MSVGRDAEPSEGGARGLLDRALAVATDVRPGEARGALLLALNVCLLLCAYYLIKPVREALILSTGGAEQKSYLSAGQVVMLSVIVPVYGLFVQKVRRQVLIPFVTLFFMGCLTLFYFAAIAEVPFVGQAFFLFVGIFNLMIVAQFWSLANDVYSQEQGERLFPILGFGASVGAVLGSAISAELRNFEEIAWLRGLGVEVLMLLAAALLGVTIVLFRLIETGLVREGGVEPETALASADSEASDGAVGASPFVLVLRSRYLLMIAVLMFLANLVNTTGEYILGKFATEWAEKGVSEGTAGGLTKKELLTAFYGDFFRWVNIAGVTLQAFFVSRIIKWFKIGTAILFLPVIALGAYSTIFLFPFLAVVRWVKTAENSTDYSLNNTVRNALFLPLSREEKYKAKQAIDTFFVRGGDVASAGLVYWGTQVAFSAVEFAGVNAVLSLAILLLGWAIGRHYSMLTRP